MINRERIKLIVTTFLMLVPVSQLLAEVSISDSLYRVYHQLKDDSTKVRLLRELAESTEFKGTVKAKELNNEALNLARKINNKPEEIWNQIAIGIWHYNEGNNRTADSIFRISLVLAERAGMKAEIASASINIGNVYYSLGSYDSSLIWYLDAARIAEELKDYKRTSGCYRNIARMYYELDNIPKAKIYAAKAKTDLERINDERGLGRNYNLWASIYSRTNERDKAIEHSLKAIYFLKKTGDFSFLQTAYQNVAYDYFDTGNYKFSDLYCDSSLTLAEKSGDANALFHTFILKGMLAEENENFKLAEVNYLNAFAYAKKDGNIIGERSFFQQMNSLYAKQNKFKEAYQFLQQYNLYNDSIKNESNIDRITEIESRYQNEKNEALASAEISKQKLIRNVIAGGTGVLIISAAFSFFFYRRRREATFKYEVSEVEMKALRAQMNPHFIFNSLNSIKNFIEKSDTEKAANYLTDFASLMRLILENSELKEVSLKDDLKALELYMKLESMRMTKKLEYKIEVDKDIDAENTLVPPLILQPFVENSIWHGLSKKEGNGRINIFIHKNDDMLECIVEDNGIGREKSNLVSAIHAIPGKKSLGMKITRSRINILNRVKKSDASVELIDLPEGLRVVVKLPLELDF